MTKTKDFFMVPLMILVFGIIGAFIFIDLGWLRPPLRVDGKVVQFHEETGFYFIEPFEECSDIQLVEIMEKKTISESIESVYFDHELNLPIAIVADDRIQILDSDGRAASELFTNIRRCGPDYLVGLKGHLNGPEGDYLLDLKGKTIVGPFAPNSITFKDGEIHARGDYWSGEKLITPVFRK